MTRYREDVLEARKTWVAFLQKPGRKKAKAVLDAGGGARCCLGHGCYVLNLVRREKDGQFVYGHRRDTGYAPAELVSTVGLLGITGQFNGGSLTHMNDKTDMTPQQIGAWIEARITGDETDSPFKPLSDYPARATPEEAA